MYLEPEHSMEQGVKTVLVLARIELTFLGLRGSTAGELGLDWSLEYSIPCDVMPSVYRWMQALSLE